MYFVYILYSTAKDKYYVGCTNQLEERVRKHNSNHKGFTGGVGDWKVVHKESYELKSKGLGREKEIKNKKSRKYIEKLVQDIPT